MFSENLNQIYKYKIKLSDESKINVEHEISNKENKIFYNTTITDSEKNVYKVSLMEKEIYIKISNYFDCVHFVEQKAENIFCEKIVDTLGNIYLGPTNENLQPHGYGKITFKNGNIVEGEFVNGIYHGNMRSSLLNGFLLMQNFSHGVPKAKFIISELNEKTARNFIQTRIKGIINIFINEYKIFIQKQTNQ